MIALLEANGQFPAPLWAVVTIGAGALLLFSVGRLMGARSPKAAREVMSQVLGNAGIERLEKVASSLHASTTAIHDSTTAIREQNEQFSQSLSAIQAHQTRAEKKDRSQLIGSTLIGVGVGALTGHLVAAQFDGEPLLDRNWEWTPWPALSSPTALAWLSVAVVVLLASAGTCLYLWLMHAYVDAKHSGGYREAKPAQRVRIFFDHLLDKSKQ